jgi:hypothetical protein
MKYASFVGREGSSMPLDDAMRRLAGIGHNGGPPLEEAPDWNDYCWRRAYQKAWKTPPREIALRRLARAEALGMTYREYQAIILDTGVYVDERPSREGEAWTRMMRKRMKRR